MGAGNGWPSDDAHRVVLGDVELKIDLSLGGVCYAQLRFVSKRNAMGMVTRVYGSHGDQTVLRGMLVYCIGIEVVVSKGVARSTEVNIGKGASRHSPTDLGSRPDSTMKFFRTCATESITC